MIFKIKLSSLLIDCSEYGLRWRGDNVLVFKLSIFWAWEGKKKWKRENLESYTSKNGLNCCTFRQKRKRHALPFHIPNPKQIRKRKVHEKHKIVYEYRNSKSAREWERERERATYKLKLSSPRAQYPKIVHSLWSSCMRGHAATENMYGGRLKKKTFWMRYARLHFLIFRIRI